MTTYNAKPTSIDAVRYDAPTTPDDEGNIAEVEAFVGDDLAVTRQTPWNPIDGQACLVLRDSVGEPLLVVKPGGYLFRSEDDQVATLDDSEFEAIYDVSVAAAVDSGDAPDPDGK